jgi:hypothetical protein
MTERLFHIDFKDTVKHIQRVSIRETGGCEFIRGPLRLGDYPRPLHQAQSATSTLNSRCAAFYAP